MPTSIPTPAQKGILELLNAFGYLTTQQIHEYLGGTTTKRATEQKLKLLADHGFIWARRLNPERGAVSERCWLLQNKDRDNLAWGDSTNLNPVSYDWKDQQKGSIACGEPLTSRDVTVLQLLAEMKQLTTKQIRQHLHAEKPEWYTWKMLYILRGRGYITSARLSPERGAASELYWALSRRGARTIGVEYSGYGRRPAPCIIEQRGLLLEMGRQVTKAGWSLLSPHPQGPRRSETHETPQRRQLVGAVLRKEGLAIEKLLLQGYPVSKLEDRIDRWNAGQVGALVPRKVKEHVAYVPGQPERTVLLIFHPPMAGRAFWTRSPDIQAASEGRYAKTGSRLSRYSRLAQVLPVLGVFGWEDVARQYAGLLQASGLSWTLVQDVGKTLAAITDTEGT